MADKDEKDKNSVAAKVTLPGVVEKIIPALTSDDPEKAQIEVQGADHLYREIRIDNNLMDENGETVALKRGAHVDVKIEAEKDAVVRKGNA